MKLERQFAFKHSTGEDIYLFTLRNAGTDVVISNYGAIITSYTIKTIGTTNNIVLGFENI